LDGYEAQCRQGCSCAGWRVARAQEVPSRARRFALALLEQREPGLRFRPRCDTAIHMRSAVTPQLMAKTWLGGGDQPLKGSNLISEATVNVLEPGGRHEITGVEEERLHLCHEHISVPEEVAHLR
jgi:hypothetical protein